MNLGGGGATPRIPDETFLQYRERYHKKLLGSVKRWAVVNTVLSEEGYVFFPREIADQINEEEPLLEQNNNKISNNYGWQYPDILSVLGRLNERLWHDQRGLRVAIPHVKRWIRAHNGIPTRPPTKADLRPSADVLDGRLDRYTRRARRIVDYASLQAGRYDTNQAADSAPAGLALRGLLLAYVAEWCEVFDGGRVERFDIESEASDEETGKEGDVRHLSIDIVIEASNLVIDDTPNLRVDLQQFVGLLARILSYNGYQHRAAVERSETGDDTDETDDTEAAATPASDEAGDNSPTEINHINWQRRISRSTQEFDAFGDMPDVNFFEDKDRIVVSHELENIRRRIS